MPHSVANKSFVWGVSTTVWAEMGDTVEWSGNNYSCSCVREHTVYCPGGTTSFWSPGKGCSDRLTIRGVVYQPWWIAPPHSAIDTPINRFWEPCSEPAGKNCSVLKLFSRRYRLPVLFWIERVSLVFLERPAFQRVLKIDRRRTPARF